MNEEFIQLEAKEQRTTETNMGSSWSGGNQDINR